ncbi:hypothetical protein VTK26DRAFT_5538 [Humicola hyalothermophila]
MKIGAGVMGYQAAKAVDAAGVVAVTAECPTVGLADFTMGGGHGRQRGPPAVARRGRPAAAHPALGREPGGVALRAGGPAAHHGADRAPGRVRHARRRHLRQRGRPQPVRLEGGHLWRQLRRAAPRQEEVGPDFAVLRRQGRRSRRQDVPELTAWRQKGLRKSYIISWRQPDVRVLQLGLGVGRVACRSCVVLAATAAFSVILTVPALYPVTLGPIPTCASGRASTSGYLPGKTQVRDILLEFDECR